RGHRDVRAHRPQPARCRRGDRIAKDDGAQASWRGEVVVVTEAGPGWLFCPADRPERFEKAAAAADVVILDLEDGVAAKHREAARAALIDTPLDPARTVVRVNPATTPDHELDLRALARTEYRTVMLAKTEAAEQVSALAPLDVVVLIET